jgi:tetratricopeptide (TPR) repeat protein
MDPNKELTFVDVLAHVYRDHPRVIWGIGAAFVLFLLLILLAAWLLFGRGPRRWRGMRAARKLLKTGAWQAALDQLKKVRAIGSPSSSWLKQFNQFEAECLQAASRSAVKEKKFEEGLEFGLRAVQILEQPGVDVRMNVQGAMLQEIRRLFSKHGETAAVQDLIGRTMLVQSPCREASFWQAMCLLRNGEMEAALMHLQTARTGVAQSFNIDEGFPDPTVPAAPPAPPSPIIDPALYLGAVLLRTGRGKESLRFLTEANRMDSNCPFITLQLGAAIVTAGGDTNMAVRALQRSLGPKGLGMWQNNPQRAWVEGLPENRSYIRKLASEFPFICPIFGEDLKFLIRQGNMALAQGYFKLNNFQEAADLFDKVLKEGAPSLPVLRGLGLSLARLGRYDDAFVHLRTAHEMEEVKDRLTAGYLALCGACGKPARPEDKLENTAWAIRLVTQFNAPGDPEWIGILNRIFAEARQSGIAMTSDEQLYLCEHLVSIKASDKLAAQAYHHLMTTESTLVHPEYAWLYCRADQQHDVGGPQAMALFAMAFAQPEPARAFFAEQKWNFEDVELMFLRRAAEQAPGRFPEILGPEYAPRGEQILISRSQQQESSGQTDAGLQTIEVLVRLSPNNTSAMDRAAALHYRAGRLHPAFELLQQWHQTQPDNPLPLVRQGLLLHQQGDDPGCFDKLRQAMALGTGRRRANIAFVGARLALQSYLFPPAQSAASDPLASVQSFLQDCLAHHPGHPQALWCRAAVAWLQGDTTSLARQATAMDDASVADPHYHYLAALCHLLGGESAPDGTRNGAGSSESRLQAVLSACERVVRTAASQHGRNGTPTPLSLGVEAGYLAGLALIDLGQPAAAIEALRPLAATPTSPTLSHAQALLGAVNFAEGHHDEAIVAWQALDAKLRQGWNLSEPLAQTIFISAVESMLRGEHEQAAEKFRQAGRLGCRDRRLGPLLLLALFKAGQQAIYAGETAPVVPAES